MQAKWGSYSFNENGCSLSSATRIITAPGTGRPIRYATRATVEGWLEGNSQSELSGLESVLRLALLTPYQDLKFLTDAGALTPISLLDRDSITGIRILSYSFPGDTGAEYATLRKFQAEVEAEFVIPGAENAVIAFQETYSSTGTGGPNTRIRTPVNTPLQVRQVLTPASVIRTTQSGSATGHLRRPVPLPPRWPAYELGPQRQSQKGSPERLGARPTSLANFTTSWAYYFESDVPLVGEPAVPPV